jgi:hypothetical protein
MNYFVELLLMNLLRDGVSGRLFRLQPLGLHVTRSGFLRGLSLSLGCFLQRLGSDADLNCIRGRGLRFLCGRWFACSRWLNCSLCWDLRRTSY